jgi:hypothetical protein
VGGSVGAYRQYKTPSLDLLELIESTAKDATLETYARLRSICAIFDNFQLVEPATVSPC